MQIIIAAVIITLIVWIWRNRKQQTKEEKFCAFLVPDVPDRQEYIPIPTYDIIPVAQFLKNPPEKYVAFDLETTGFNARLNAILEFGAVYVENGRCVKTFSQLVNPGCSIPAEASEVNHITDRMVKNCPTIDVVLLEFRDFVGDAPVLAAHNVKFDADFLVAAAQKCNILINFKFFDTLALARYIWPNLSDHKLGTVAAHVGYNQQEAHRALDDATAAFAIITDAQRENRKNELKKTEDRQRQKEEFYASIKIKETDHAMFSNRCPLSDVMPASDMVSVEKGRDYWAQGDALKRIDQLENALILFNKARYYGYNSPALYESYAVTLRKLGRYAEEAEILDEYLARNPGLKAEKFQARKQRAEELLEKSKLK